MSKDRLQHFVRLRRELQDERGQLETRLRQINEALGEMPLPSLSPIQGAIGRSADHTGGGQSLREHVLAVLQDGPKTKEEVLAAVQKRGYKFSTTDPLNSLGVILYGKNPKLNRVEGRFALSGGAVKAASARDDSAPPSKRGGKRKMSLEARERIAAAQRARWAKQKGGK